MKAEQGIEVFNAIKMQMSSVEQIKFQKMILEQVEDHQKKITECLVLFQNKHCKNQKLRTIKKL